MELDTPYLEVDLAVLDANLARQGAAARAAGVALRPHAKTHKSAAVAARQLAAGATGLTLATVAEGEAFADAGFDDLFLAYPVWAGGSRGRRLRALAERTRLRVGVDSVEGVRALARAASPEVLVEIDSGHHRTGVAPGDAVAVARAALDAGLDVVGVFTFPGHAYRPGAARDAARDEADALSAAGDALAGAGIEARVRSGGSTPTAAHTDTRVVTEVRPGVSVFGDAQQLELGTCDVTALALTAVATVVCARPGRIVLDAGSKVLGADRPPWTTGHGRLLEHPDARITALSEHHATVELAAATPTPALGEPVRVVPNHVCSAVNLADVLVAHDPATGRRTAWPVTARGANT